MSINLSLELQNQIVYGMENQGQSFYLDLDTMTLVSEKTIDRTELKSKKQYIPIPNWKPSDGFQLMEQFVSQLRNPMVREELADILKYGKGVFKGFKKVLKAHPEVENKWFDFKEKHMRTKIKLWFAEIKELENLEVIYAEELDEDSSDLLYQDFVFETETTEYDSACIALDRECFKELFSQTYGGDQFWYNYLRKGIPPLNSSDSGQYVVSVCTSDGDLLGFIWLQNIQEDGSAAIWAVQQLYLIEMHRDIGLGTALLEIVKKHFAAASRFVWLVPGHRETWKQILKKAGELEIDSNGIATLEFTKTVL